MAGRETITVNYNGQLVYTARVITTRLNATRKSFDRLFVRFVLFVICYDDLGENRRRFGMETLNDWTGILLLWLCERQIGVNKTCKCTWKINPK
jgi:hypothetical protein